MNPTTAAKTFPMPTRMAQRLSMEAPTRVALFLEHQNPILESSEKDLLFPRD
jgi:hypothetical protein